MSNIVNIYLVRHAESEANVDARNVIGGQNIGVHLTPKGEKQAYALGNEFINEGLNFDAAFTSMALRTQETAQITLGVMNYKGNIAAYPELLEQDPGDWEGQSRSIYDRPDVRLALDTDNWNFIPGDIRKGESQRMIGQRMVNWFMGIVDYYSQSPGTSNIVVFSHGLAIKYFLAELLNLPRSTAFMIHIDNTSVTYLQYINRKLVLPRLNDTRHYSLIH